MGRLPAGTKHRILVCDGREGPDARLRALQNWLKEDRNLRRHAKEAAAHARSIAREAQRAVAQAATESVADAEGDASERSIAEGGACGSQTRGPETRGPAPLVREADEAARAAAAAAAGWEHRRGSLIFANSSAEVRWLQTSLAEGGQRRTFAVDGTRGAGGVVPPTGSRGEGGAEAATKSRRADVFGALRRKTPTLLIASDVLSRGLDIEGLTHVVNFGLPRDGPTGYVHRAGRVGRRPLESLGSPDDGAYGEEGTAAGRPDADSAADVPEGVVISVLTRNEARRLAQWSRENGWGVEFAVRHARKTE
jgi:superfamily II DNA/RNA helicase